jgi:hypothetical protein
MHVEVTRMLLKRGTGVTAQGEDGQTTKERGQMEISHIPDERGVDTTAQAEHLQTDFHLVSTGALTEVTHTLVVRQEKDGPTQTEMGDVGMPDDRAVDASAGGLGPVEAARTPVERGMDAKVVKERTGGLRRIWNNLRAHLCSCC